MPSRVARLRVVDDESSVTGCACAGHADFGIRFEAADSRPLPRARADDDEWPLPCLRENGWFGPGPQPGVKEAAALSPAGRLRRRAQTQVTMYR